MNFIITDYIEKVMNKAIYNKLQDETFTGKILECKEIDNFEKKL